MGHIIDTGGSALTAWEQLAEKDLPPEKMRIAIGKHVIAVSKRASATRGE